MEKLTGVVISDFSDSGLTPLKWASDYMKLPTNHKLCIILVKLEENTSIGEALNWGELESRFKAEVERAFPREWKQRTKMFQEYAGKFPNESVVGRMCKGRSYLETLQRSIDKLPGLNTLVIGCEGAADAGSQITAQTEVKLSGINNVVLAKRIDHADKKTLRFSAALVQPATPNPPTSSYHGEPARLRSKNPGSSPRP